MAKAAQPVTNRRRSITLSARALELRQRADVLYRAAPQRGKRVAPLQRGNDPSLRVALGDRDELLRDPSVVGFEQLQIGEQIGRASCRERV